MFEPIAIVGRACLLPGAHTPEQFWQNILYGKNSLDAATRELWGIEPEYLLTKNLRSEDQIPTTHCGFIKNFNDIFDPNEFQLSADYIRQWDVILPWLLYTGRAALHDAGFIIPQMKLMRAGAIIGNLGYPTFSFGKLAESIWLSQQAILKDQIQATTAVHPHNRFTSALPLFKMAEGLGLTQIVYGIDAACASSLYAIRLACDELHARKADIMLTGGINAVDSLFLQMGFSALHALSSSGDSLPFHMNANGLIPSQGAALVVLKRLDDAIDMNDHIYGVIRSVGLSNDGAGKTLLTPTLSGQMAAMQQAYREAKIDPEEVSWVECHATGTPLGDATEIHSMREIFQPKKPLSIGALKANIGHSITTSGAAALINVLSAMNAKIKPPARTASQALALVAESGFHLPKKAEAWESSRKKRLAAVNCFGFGGNNAHLLVEEFIPNFHPSKKNSIAKKSIAEPIAVVGFGIMAGSIQNKQEFAELIRGMPLQSLQHEIENIALSLENTPFPPLDLRSSLGQQLAIIKTSQEALSGLHLPAPERSNVLMGIQCDAECTRFGLRWRLSALLPDIKNANWLQTARDAIRPAEQGADIVGCMPNIVANRINHIYDFKGPSYSVFSEELSGIHALQIGIRNLQQHQLDMAVIGAVDLCCESIHRAAAKSVLSENKHLPGDAAVVFVLKRLQDAKRMKESIYGIIHEPNFDNPQQDVPNNLTQKIGHAHAAVGLLEVANALLTCNENPGKIRIHLTAFGGKSANIDIEAATLSNEKQL